ncbi:MAG: hypothetical protein V9E87_17615 [Gemmatimonadales bacterium]
MLRAFRKLTIAAVLCTAACGGDATGPGTNNYEQVAGSYSGPLNSIEGGVLLQGTLSFTLTQDDGTIGGSWAMSGTLFDGVTVVEIQGTGPIVGTIAAGGNPSVNLQTRNPGCPNVTSTFSGVYDVANHRIPVAGTAQFFNSQNCQVFHSHPLQLLITR